jgi:hypothetical protein
MKGKSGSFVFLALFVCTSGLLAQESGVQVGGATLFPSIGLGIGYDDNITLSPDEEISSWYYLISPAIRLQTGSRRNEFLFEYGIDHADYQDSELDNYTDQWLSGIWHYTPTIRDEFSLSGRYQWSHDRRGEGLREFFPGSLPREVDEFELYSIDASYRHGADGARGKLELDAGLTGKQYQNNRELTRIGDYDQTRLSGAFYWRVANKTSLLVEAGVKDTDFDFSARDNDELFVGIGVAWEASARTEGRASYRYLDVDFDDDPQADYTGSGWEVSVRWMPKVYSVFEVTAIRETDVAFGSSNLLVREEVDVSWRHEWRPRFASFVDAGFLTEDFDPGLRDDDSFFYGIGASYSARHWLDVGVSYRHYDRDSSLPVFDYERNEFLLSFELSL